MDEYITKKEFIKIIKEFQSALSVSGTISLALAMESQNLTQVISRAKEMLFAGETDLLYKPIDDSQIQKYRQVFEQHLSFLQEYQNNTSQHD